MYKLLTSHGNINVKFVFRFTLTLCMTTLLVHWRRKRLLLTTNATGRRFDSRTAQIFLWPTDTYYTTNTQVLYMLCVCKRTRDPVFIQSVERKTL